MGILFKRRLLAVILAVAATLALNGCFLAANREITLLVTRTDTGSEATITYRMPPPEEGKVYVLWVMNGDNGRSLRIGTVEPSPRLRAVRTRVDFWVTGAVISIESSPEPAQMSSDWELVSGQVGPKTPSPLGAP